MGAAKLPEQIVERRNSGLQDLLDGQKEDQVIAAVNAGLAKQRRLTSPSKRQKPAKKVPQRVIKQNELVRERNELKRLLKLARAEIERLKTELAKAPKSKRQQRLENEKRRAEDERRRQAAREQGIREGRIMPPSVPEPKKSSSRAPKQKLSLKT